MDNYVTIQHYTLNARPLYFDNPIKLKIIELTILPGGISVMVEI